VGLFRRFILEVGEKGSLLLYLAENSLIIALIVSNGE